MYDSALALRILNKANKELVTAMTNATQPVVRDAVQKAFNDLTFMYDVLHLDDDIKVIDINNQ